MIVIAAPRYSDSVAQLHRGVKGLQNKLCGTSEYENTHTDLDTVFISSKRVPFEEAFGDLLHSITNGSSLVSSFVYGCPSIPRVTEDVFSSEHLTTLREEVSDILDGVVFLASINAFAPRANVICLSETRKDDNKQFDLSYFLQQTCVNDFIRTVRGLHRHYQPFSTCDTFLAQCPHDSAEADKSMRLDEVLKLLRTSYENEINRVAKKDRIPVKTALGERTSGGE